MVIGIDFDGTIVEDRYPEIGRERLFATETLRKLIEDGHRLILWTVREGDLLDEAVKWCEERGVVFYSVNKDYIEEMAGSRHFSRKIKADVFIDDRNIGGIPDWGVIYELISKRMTLEEYLMNGGEVVSKQPHKKRWWQL